MKLSPGERAALNRAVVEIRKILRAPDSPAFQLMLNINNRTVQSVDYKFHEPIQGEAVGG